MDVYKSPVGQPKLKFKDVPFEFSPAPDNRWVRLAEIVPWEELELLSGYRNHFGSTGNPALPFRVAFGALLVQTRLCLTDEETLEQIRENPYIQYFLGFEGYRSEKRPFDPSMMVYFRKRLDAETLKALDLRILAQKAGAPSDRHEREIRSFGRLLVERRREAEEAAKKAEEAAKKEDEASSVPEPESAPVDVSEEETPPSASPETPCGCDAPTPEGAPQESPSPAKGDAAPKGTLILDATCAPADITYPYNGPRKTDKKSGGG